MSSQQPSVEPTGRPLVIDPSSGDEQRPDSTLSPDDILRRFMRVAQELVKRLRKRDEEFVRILQITERVNYGLILEEVLEFVYREMRQVIPYNRIGFSLIDPDKGTVTAHWARSDRPMLLAGGYEAKLAGSTLEQIIATGRPRIINNLEAYLHKKPTSDSTSLVVREGMRSSLTCPLIVQGKPVGFMFFSSAEKGTYSNMHVAFFQQIAGQLAAIVEKGRLYQVLAEQKSLIEEQNNAMTRDLEMARQVQRALVPSVGVQVDGLQVAFDYTPAIQVGGDIVDIIPLGQERVLLFVGDAMGHGVQAALVMSVVKTALHGSLREDIGPDQVLTEINKSLIGLLGDRFVTAACCVLDTSTRRLQIALAGHPQPMLQRQGGRIELVGDGGLPLGVQDDFLYQQVETKLERGESLLIFSDGAVEALDTQGNPYGTECLEQQFRQHGSGNAKDVLDALKQDLQTRCGPDGITDDLTLLVAKAQ